MKLNFKNIIIENFLSIGKMNIDLSDNGYVFVKGFNENTEDNAKSNGSGKSSIWEAISWCLTGDFIRGKLKDISNLNGDDGAYVQLTFECDGSDYVITRTKDHSKYKTNLKISINGEDKSGKGIRDTEKLLEEYLPDLTPVLIGSVIILGQGLPQKFSSNSPSGRKEVLETLSKSDFMINDLKIRIGKRKDLLNRSLRDIEDSILRDNTNLENQKETLIKLESKLESFSNNPNFDEMISDLNSNCAQLKLDIEEKEKLIEELSAKKEDCNERIRELYNSWQEVSGEIMLFYKDKKEAATQDFTDAKVLLSTAINELEELKKIKDVCPTCGQKIQGIELPNIAEKESIIEQLRYKYEDAKKVFDSISKQERDDLDHAKKINNDENARITSIYNETIRALDIANSEKKTLHSQVMDCLLKISAVENERDNLAKNIQECKESIDSVNLLITKLNEQLLYNNIERDNIIARLEIINKFNTIVTRDFRGFLLTNVIEYIQKKSKEYAMDIFHNDKIEFTLDGNLIYIAYNGKQYEALSGGEKQKVDLIIQFSIRDMLCNFLNFSSNILVVDEIFDNLDNIGCQEVINLISTKLSDISSIYIVSHHTDIDIPCDKELIVIKDKNGVSRLRL
jgi:DNA repair exonuclease SbcCD ATPase subunit